MRATIVLLTAIAVGLLGLAPVVVCQMPPECPMRGASQGHDCCGGAVPGNGLAKTLCHPMSAPAVVPQALEASPLLIGALATSERLADPIAVARAMDLTAPAAAIPRFLLTHTFRL